MKAIVITNDDAYTAQLIELKRSELPAGEVLVQVEYSTINYKDALAITGNGPVVRSFPMVPGIDLAGEVLESASPDFAAGDKILLNGHGVGELYWGGLSQEARLKASWLIKLPDGFTTKDAMAIGTAGYTAQLCVTALENHGITPASGDILVTGATGGVGSVAIALLAKRGYRTDASTGSVQGQAMYLNHLGASSIIDRAELSDAGRPLQKERWAGAIDVAGSHTLANICASMKYGGVVAACGLAQGPDFPTTVMPFILRGITLCGIDSVYASQQARSDAWAALARDLDMEKLASMTTQISIDEAIPAASDLLNGKICGRIVVNMQA